MGLGGVALEHHLKSVVLRRHCLQSSEGDCPKAGKKGKTCKEGTLPLR